MMSEEQLRRVERILLDTGARYKRRSIEEQAEYAIAVAVLLADYRRLRERVAELERIEAGVRRMIEELKQ